MPILKDMSDTPRSDPTSVGAPPDKTPRFGPVLAESWMELFGNEQDSKPMADERARIRHSWAANCSRRIGYEITEGVVRSNPMTVADHWRLGLGQAVHTAWQEAILARFPHAVVEPVSTFDDGLIAGSGDLLVTFEGKRVEVEAKTINGFGFKKSMGARGEAGGPRWSAVVQGSLNALAHGADELVILYLSLELLSPRERDKLKVGEVQRFIGEWTYTREQFEPIAQAELDRFRSILDDVDAGELPPRMIPDPEIPQDALITNPAKGEWRIEAGGLIYNTGSTWHCAYCPFQGRCSADMAEGL